jgi:2-hydroxy-6-oxonona-2,4-dienedioate hydrolase
VYVDPLVNSYGRFLDTGNGRVYMEELGPKDGTAVVLVHGFAGSTFSFRGNGAVLAKAGFRVLALDLPGFGLSEKGTRPDYCHAAQAETIREVMDLNGLHRAVFVGHSTGANVVLHLAQRHPGRTLAIVTVAGAPVFEREWRIQSFLLRCPLLASAGRVALSRLTTPARVRKLLERAVANSATVTDVMVDGYYSRLTRGKWESAMIAVTLARPRNKLDVHPSNITVPVLLVAGAQDRWVPTSQSVGWASGLSNAWSEIMPEVGHLPMEEHPSDFNSLVLHLLANIGASRGSP